MTTLSEEWCSECGQPAHDFMCLTPLSGEELRALEQAIVAEIENPTVKSEISTSDIRVMGISSTGMQDRMFTIMKLIRRTLAQREVNYRADLAQAIGYCQGLGYPNSYLEKRYPELAFQTPEQERMGDGK